MEYFVSGYHKIAFYCISIRTKAAGCQEETTINNVGINTNKTVLLC
jgi:hypothetical protein